MKRGIVRVVKWVAALGRRELTIVLHECLRVEVAVFVVGEEEDRVKDLLEDA